MAQGKDRGEEDTVPRQPERRRVSDSCFFWRRSDAYQPQLERGDAASRRHHEHLTEGRIKH